jgi:hypothetical protein
MCPESSVAWLARWLAVAVEAVRCGKEPRWRRLVCCLGVFVEGSRQKSLLQPLEGEGSSLAPRRRRLLGGWNDR